jgi:hypothetical protein
VAGLARWSVDPVLAAHTSSIGVLLAASGRDLEVRMADAEAVLAALVRRARGGNAAAVSGGRACLNVSWALRRSWARLGGGP